MKILFICGALEPGRDGVGDYTRRLAVAIQQMGHQSSIIALYDRYIDEEMITEQPVDDGCVHVLRIPGQTNHTNRYQRVKEWVNAFEPGWISLQFVPYAYHPKGMPFLLGRELQKLLVNERRLHIMLHETWIGVEKRFDLKRKLIGALQKNIIRRMIKSLHPAVIHTQLPFTLRKMEAIAPGIQPLPLFSNIEVFSQPGEKHASVLRAGFFSQADASPAVISFLENLSKNAAASGIQLELLFIGGDPVKMKLTGNTIAKSGKVTANILYTGFLSPEDISLALQSCTLGITLVPRHALGKSGSVAAFLQHGIPVAAPIIYNGTDPAEIGFFSRKLSSAILLTPDLNAMAIVEKAAIAAKNEIGLQVITKIFLENICVKNQNNSD
jgi:hypothetical protein